MLNKNWLLQAVDQVNKFTDMEASVLIEALI